jgi:hypothetical protein
MISTGVILAFVGLAHAIAWRWDRDPQGHPCRRLHLLPVLLLVPFELFAASGTLEHWLLTGYAEPAWTRHTVAMAYLLLAVLPLYLALQTFHNGRRLMRGLQAHDLDNALPHLVIAYLQVRVIQSAWSHWFESARLAITFWAIPGLAFLAGIASRLVACPQAPDGRMPSPFLALALLGSAGLATELLAAAGWLGIDPFRTYDGDPVLLADAASAELGLARGAIPLMAGIAGCLAGSRLASGHQDKYLSTAFYLTIAYLSWRLALGYFGHLLPELGSMPQQLAGMALAALLTGLAIGLVTTLLRRRLHRNDPIARAAPAVGAEPAP